MIAWIRSLAHYVDFHILLPDKKKEGRGRLFTLLDLSPMRMISLKSLANSEKCLLLLLLPELWILPPRADYGIVKFHLSRAALVVVT